MSQNVITFQIGYDEHVIADESWVVMSHFDFLVFLVGGKLLWIFAFRVVDIIRIVKY